jgi:hypothetical protein
MFDDFEDDGVFYRRFGPAQADGVSPCQLKLCFAATNLNALARILRALVARPDWYFVKMDKKLGPHGMLRGRCFLTDRDEVIRLWKHYKTTDVCLCTLQNDEDVVAQR